MNNQHNSPDHTTKIANLQAAADEYAAKDAVELASHIQHLKGCGYCAFEDFVVENGESHLKWFLARRDVQALGEFLLRKTRDDKALSRLNLNMSTTPKGDLDREHFYRRYVATRYPLSKFLAEEFQLSEKTLTNNIRLTREEEHQAHLSLAYAGLWRPKSLDTSALYLEDAMF